LRGGVNHPQLSQGASCLSDGACSATTACAGAPSRGAISAGFPTFLPLRFCLAGARRSDQSWQLIICRTFEYNSPNSGFPFSFRSTIRDCVSVCFSFIPFSCTRFSSESRRLYSHLQSSSWRFSIFSVFFDGYRRNL